DFAVAEDVDSTLDVAVIADEDEESEVELEMDEDDLDEIDSVDYDEWATVFLADSDSKLLGDSEREAEESFMDYFEEEVGDNEVEDEKE
ncbi:MAG: hypothetical protein HUK22_06880, partial [Thermoguttaceae bacterium]|nr:hypothetical protein [Thermoguttaceae bacterium]